MQSSSSPLLTDLDLYLHGEGTFLRSFEKLGGHLLSSDSANPTGAHFAVWAPNASYVSVVGDFNGWNRASNPLTPRGSSGIWEGVVSSAHHGNCYKYFIQSNIGGYTVEKADPYAFSSELRPKTASRLWDISRYSWKDSDWMDARAKRDAFSSPMTIYEVHLGSWMRVPERGDGFLTYRELAHELPRYMKKMGFTHVELLPITEHPFDGSWGYQTTGYFAPTSRFGTPDDFMYLVDSLHQHNIGVILDWVPAHFPTDEFSLSFFDGTHLYEHADPRKGFHPDWDTAIFNFGRPEVRNFLLSSALFWLEYYHIDALRVDAVASMLYLDYSRKPGEWIPNEFGGRENLEAISFLKRLNEEVFSRFPGVLTMAEESTAWPMVSRPTYCGGLGFGMKWNMGWMNDFLRYMNKETIHRQFHQNDLTFSLIYAFDENFLLPLSHDEVVHGKGSLINKMPGDRWQQFANLRLSFGYQYAHPGKKLLFMGMEFAQSNEWNHDQSLDWHLLAFTEHQHISRFVGDLNRLVTSTPALYEIDFSPVGFSWLDCADSAQSVVSFLRFGNPGSAPVLVIANFTPVPRTNYRLGVPTAGTWKELLNSDSHYYGGSGMGNLGSLATSPISFHGHPQSVELTLPPLSILFFTPESVK